MVERRNSPRKLGLALAGGGFRAALFHVGVLRRLAELNLLRRVEVISAVSGGSIVAAQYALLLRKEMGETARDLPLGTYISLVDRLEEDLVASVRKNLRLRLLYNPLWNMRVMLTPATLGTRMARLYERHIFRRVVSQIGPALSQRRPGEFPLRGIRIDVGPAGKKRGSLDVYNAAHLYDGDDPLAEGSAVTALILNATTLNSGGRFTFSVSEIGDSRLGLFRYDEIKELRARKRWLQERSIEDLDEAISKSDVPNNDVELQSKTLRLIRWWRDGPQGEVAPPDEDLWAALGMPGELAAENVDMGDLRRAEAAAERFLTASGSDPAPEAVLERVWNDLLDALGSLDPDLALGARIYGTTQVERRKVACLVDDWYLLRAAERVSTGIKEDWDALTLGDAVGASASFPPVFPPVVHTGIYDDAFVAQLGLTDGGVYDNTGIQALLDAGCTEIIASDTGGVFRPRQRVNASRPRLMGRIVSIVREAGARRQREALRLRRRLTQRIEESFPPRDDSPPPPAEFARFKETHGLDELVYFHINSPPVTPTAVPSPLSPGPDRRALAELRTDLDSFGRAEIAMLVNHGYDTADRYVRRYLTSGWTDYELRRPEPEVEAAHAARVLRAGRSRFLRWLLLLPAWAVGLPVLLAFLAVLNAWRGWLPLEETISRAGGWLVKGARSGLEIADVAVLWLLEQPVAGPILRAIGTVFGLAWDYRVTVAVLLLLVGAAAGIHWGNRPSTVSSPSSAQENSWRRRGTGKAHQAIRGYAGNLLWLLALAPLWLAFAGSLWALASRLFDRLFLLRADKTEPP